MKNVKVNIDEATIRKIASEGIADAYRKRLSGKRCPTHGEPVKVEGPDSTGAVSLTGCCDEFVQKASQALK